MKLENYKKEKLKDKRFAEKYAKLTLNFSIARQVITIRHERELTQKQLADLVGTKQSAISRLESGDRLPSLSMLQTIADELNCDIEVKFVERK